MPSPFLFAPGSGVRAVQLCLVAAALAGCGAPADFTCSPACPPGMRCAFSGCVLEEAVELGVAAVTDLADECAPACAGSTPYCNAHLQCVGCRVDADCPMGTLCQSVGSAAFCMPGCRDDQGCRGGGVSATVACCTGQCLDTASDVRNCGGCGGSCASASSTALCVAGACATGSCNPGLADCNGLAGDGCEVALALDAANCGACGHQCVLEHATASCDGACYIGACRFGWGDCDGVAANGCELDTLRDIGNCGACGNDCSAPSHARVACVNGTCEPSSCVAGFGDCNGLQGDGCESDLQSDAVNCGACGQPCGLGEVCNHGACTCPDCTFANAQTTCFKGQCALGKCLAGFANCNMVEKDGCEVDVGFDPLNCGGCGVACPGKEACQNGACVTGGVDAWGAFHPSLHCADFSNQGQYRQYCFECLGATLCIGQVNGGFSSCDDADMGLHFVFDLTNVYPMRFNPGGMGAPDCLNYDPAALQNLALALGYNTYSVNTKSGGNVCQASKIDDHGMFAASGPSGDDMPYDVTFNF